MPIANCFVASSHSQATGNLIELWSNKSGISDEHMTVNIISIDQQLGNKYAVMANLQLPSVWSSDQVYAIQLGLAQALSCYFSVAVNEVHVITNIIDSGMVVEKGELAVW